MDNTNKIMENNNLIYCNSCKGLYQELTVLDIKIYIDPGKRSLIRCVDDNDKWFNYTNRTYLKRTKRLKYQNICKKIKNTPIKTIYEVINETEIETIGNAIEKILKDENNIEINIDNALMGGNDEAIEKERYVIVECQQWVKKIIIQ